MKALQRGILTLRWLQLIRPYQLVVDCCRRHAVVLHPKKNEVKLISRQKFVGPLQAFTINGTSINFINSTTCLGVVLNE